MTWEFEFPSGHQTKGNGMKFKKYVKLLKKYLKENPESANFTVVYSADDEGNGFQVVSFGPSVGNFDGEYRGDFMSDEDDLAEYEYDVNAVCIN